MRLIAASDVGFEVQTLRQEGLAIKRNRIVALSDGLWVAEVLNPIDNSVLAAVASLVPKRIDTPDIKVVRDVVDSADIDLCK